MGHEHPGTERGINVHREGPPHSVPPGGGGGEWGAVGQRAG